MNHILDVEGIHTYIGQFHILEGVSLSVRRESITVLLGRNGAGKTTTLRSIMGLTPPSQGRVVFNGEEIQGQLWGVPDNSQMFNPRIVSGRALLPDDGRAILLNSKIASDHDIKVGETVTLTVAEEELTWTVVGLILNVNNLQRDNFVPFDTLAKEIGNANRGAFVMMSTEAHDFETHERIIRELRAVYEAQRLKPVFFQSGGELRQQTKAQFDMIVYLMLAMAILAAIVPGQYPRIPIPVPKISPPTSFPQSRLFGESFSRPRPPNRWKRIIDEMTAVSMRMRISPRVSSLSAAMSTSSSSNCSSP